MLKFLSRLLGCASNSAAYVVDPSLNVQANNNQLVEQVADSAANVVDNVQANNNQLVEQVANLNRQAENLANEAMIEARNQEIRVALNARAQTCKIRWHTYAEGLILMLTNCFAALNQIAFFYCLTHIRVEPGLNIAREALDTGANLVNNYAAVVVRDILTPIVDRNIDYFVRDVPLAYYFRISNNPPEMIRIRIANNLNHTNRHIELVPLEGEPPRDAILVPLNAFEENAVNTGEGENLSLFGVVEEFLGNPSS